MALSNDTKTLRTLSNSQNHEAVTPADGIPSLSGSRNFLTGNVSRVDALPLSVDSTGWDPECGRYGQYSDSSVTLGSSNSRHSNELTTKAFHRSLSAGITYNDMCPPGAPFEIPNSVQRAGC
jgi:hypothetical protein